MSVVRIRRCIAILAVLVLTSCGGGHDPVPLLFEATLNGRQELPATATNAFGTGVVTVDVDRRTLIVSVVLFGTDATQVLLQSGTPGLVGPTLVALTRQPADTVWTASIAIDESQLAALRAGGFYLNATSSVFPNGEVRGQLVELFPSPQHLQVLQQVSGQSLLVQRQLQQIQDVEDEAWDGPFVGIGFWVGF